MSSPQKIQEPTYIDMEERTRAFAKLMHTYAKMKNSLKAGKNNKNIEQLLYLEIDKLECKESDVDFMIREVRNNTRKANDVMIGYGLKSYSHHFETPSQGYDVKMERKMFFSPGEIRSFIASLNENKKEYVNKKYEKVTEISLPLIFEKNERNKISHKKNRSRREKKESTNKEENKTNIDEDEYNKSKEYGNNLTINTENDENFTISSNYYYDNENNNNIDNEKYLDDNNKDIGIIQDKNNDLKTYKKRKINLWKKSNINNCNDVNISKDMNLRNNRNNVPIRLVRRKEDYIDSEESLNSISKPKAKYLAPLRKKKVSYSMKLTSISKDNNKNSQNNSVSLSPLKKCLKNIDNLNNKNSININIYNNNNNINKTIIKNKLSEIEETEENLKVNKRHISLQLKSRIKLENLDEEINNTDVYINNNINNYITTNNTISEKENNNFNDEGSKRFNTLEEINTTNTTKSIYKHKISLSQKNIIRKGLNFDFNKERKESKKNTIKKRNTKFKNSIKNRLIQYPSHFPLKLCKILKTKNNQYNLKTINNEENKYDKCFSDLDKIRKNLLNYTAIGKNIYRDNEFGCKIAKMRYDFINDKFFTKM